jgi:hypothetical protein
VALAAAVCRCYCVTRATAAHDYLKEGVSRGGRVLNRSMPSFLSWGELVTPGTPQRSDRSEGLTPIPNLYGDGYRCAMTTVKGM